MPVKPVYLRVIEDITERIQKGELKPGERLPPPGVLAAEYEHRWKNSVSAATVRRATDTLQDRGLLIGHQGVAVFVAPPPPPVDE